MILNPFKDYLTHTRFNFFLVNLTNGEMYRQKQRYRFTNVVTYAWKEGEVEVLTLSFEISYYYYYALLCVVN